MNESYQMLYEKCQRECDSLRQSLTAAEERAERAEAKIINANIIAYHILETPIDDALEADLSMAILEVGCQRDLARSRAIKEAISIARKYNPADSAIVIELFGIMPADSITSFPKSPQHAPIPEKTTCEVSAAGVATEEAASLTREPVEQSDGQ